MDSNTNLNSSSGLLRFRSAPSSFLSYFADDAGLNTNSNNTNKVSPIETERLFSRYVNDAESWPSSFQELEDKSTVVMSSQSQQQQQQVGVGLPPHYPRQQSSSYGLVSSASLDHHPPQPKTVSGASLVRQSSSPAGLFSYTSVQNNEYPFGAWNDPSSYAENLGGMRRDQDNDGKIFSAAQNGDIVNRIQILSHHLSLPKNTAEAAMEKFLQLQDSVPCKVRAKRGCATHPRSIAERVRRTRISERMRKLQELVPNMDKQTNTADMLDLAVDYIKELQKQFKSLSDVRANCKCSSKQKPGQKRIV